MPETNSALNGSDDDVDGGNSLSSLKYSSSQGQASMIL